MIKTVNLDGIQGFWLSFPDPDQCLFRQEMKNPLLNFYTQHVWVSKISAIASGRQFKYIHAHISQLFDIAWYSSWWQLSRPKLCKLKQTFFQFSSIKPFNFLVAIGSLSGYEKNTSWRCCYKRIFNIIKQMTLIRHLLRPVYRNRFLSEILSLSPSGSYC